MVDTLKQEAVSVLGGGVQSSNSSNFHKSVNNAVQQRMSQVDEDINSGGLIWGINTGPRHFERLRNLHKITL